MVNSPIASRAQFLQTPHLRGSRSSAKTTKSLSCRRISAESGYRGSGWAIWEGCEPAFPYHPHLLLPFVYTRRSFSYRASIGVRLWAVQTWHPSRELQDQHQAGRLLRWQSILHRTASNNVLFVCSGKDTTPHWTLCVCGLVNDPSRSCCANEPS
jgi:hypothetical protein